MDCSREKHQATSLFVFVFFALLVSPSFSGFLASVTKHHDDHYNPYYTLSVYLKTPLQPTDLLLDLGATYTKIDCTRNYTSTTSHLLPCNTTLCSSLQFPHRVSTNCDIRGRNSVVSHGCVLLPQHSFAMVDLLALPTTDGRNPGRLSLIPEFVFSCSNTSSYLLRGRARNEITGLAGMGLSRFSLPAQVSTFSFSLDLFALCLSGSPSAPGVAFLDHAGPYYFLPGIDISNSLNYTPILPYPVSRSTVRSYAQRSTDEYFIGVTSIKINGKPINLNQQRLTIDQKGYGGTRISTLHPYTVMERSIFKAFTEAFANESAAMRLMETNPVRPFSLCYLADDLLETHVGPTVPTVDLVMQSDDVFWRMHGKNSMVRIVRESLDVWCLGFVDGGIRSRASIVIGGHQIEDNLLQFDMGRKRLGFTSSLLVRKTMCGNFNFTTNSTI